MDFADLHTLHMQSPSLCQWLQERTGVEGWVVRSGTSGFTAMHAREELSPQASISAAICAWEVELRARGLWLK